MSHNRNRDGGQRYNARPDAENAAPEVITEDETVSDEEYLKSVSGPAATPPNALMFNTAGIQPVECVYRLQVSELKRVFLDICRKVISDVEAVTAKYDPVTGDFFWYARFAENSQHFYDGSMTHTALSDKKSFTIDEEMKTFAQKFGMNPREDLICNDHREPINKEFAKASKIQKSGGRDRINLQFLFIPNTDGSGNQVRSYSMRLSMSALLKVAFDIDGIVFKNKYNVKPPRCNISVEPKFNKVRESSDVKYGAPKYIEVRKMLPNNGNVVQGPRENFRFREA